jgi:hypothetical protein
VEGTKRVFWSKMRLFDQKFSINSKALKQVFFANQQAFKAWIAVETKHRYLGFFHLILSLFRSPETAWNRKLSDVKMVCFLKIGAD